MDLRGHEAINSAVTSVLLPDEQGHEAVIPTPEANSEVRFVTVKTPMRVAPSVVLNALGEAGLMYRPELEDKVEGPLLNVVFGQPGSITLEDLNC